MDYSIKKLLKLSSFNKQRSSVCLVEFLSSLGHGLVLFICILFFFVGRASGQFVHPGGLHTQADLDRMKEKVADGVHPWIDDWNRLIVDPLAQNTYSAAARGNMGTSRQRADADAHAAYLNTLRWYISGDTTYAACAVRICNAWANAVDQVPTGTDIPGLSGIPVFDFALAAEILRVYPGWDTAAFNKFKNMMVTYWYPVCHNFLTNHNGACITHYWANWDIANTGALIAMGVLCDDTAKFNEGIRYFKEGGGAGNINNAVYHLYSPTLGQWQESGRDQEHAQLGVGMMGYYCQVAWNQGIDLFGYENNKLMAGAEYVAKTNLSLPVPYTPYNNCDNVQQKWLSINGIGRLDDRPIWELLYNHYVVQQGLTAPNIQAMAGVIRPELGSTDHLGYGTLTFTLDPLASPITTTIPAAPTGLLATAGIGNVALSWQAPVAANVQGYQILRATAAGGPYTTVASWTRSSYPYYTDNTVSNDSTYYYVIAASNQAGLSSNSAEVNATPKTANVTLPIGWTTQTIGTSLAGSAAYAPVAGNAFVINGSGQLGGVSDAVGGYTYGLVNGDFTYSVRVIGMGGSQTGIMVRESLAADSRAYIMKRGDVGWREGGYGSRSQKGGSVKWVSGNDYTWIPAWFKLERNGDSITGYESGDGSTWFKVAGDTITAANLYVGFLATSGSTSNPNNSMFDHVNLTVSNTTSPAAPTELTGVGGNTLDTIHWSIVPGASSYSVKRGDQNGGPYTILAANLNVTEYQDTGLINGKPYYYVVTASSLNGESVNAAEISITPQLAIPVRPDSIQAVSISLQKTVLNWKSALTADYYIVKRATSAGGPYINLDKITVTNYIDSMALDSALTYYYVVSANNAMGESPNAMEVRVRPGYYTYYDFEDPDSLITSAFDSWGGHTGLLKPGVLRINGYLGKGVGLGGTSDAYLSLPKGLMGGITDFTLSAWVRPTVITTWQRIFDFGSGTDHYMFLTMSSGNTVRYAIKNGGTEQVVNGTGLMSIGVWHYVAITQSGKVATLYIDGQQVGQNIDMSLNPDSLSFTSQNYVGKSQFNDPMLNASVDEFRIYSRALTSTEIEAMVPPATPENFRLTSGNNISSLSWKASDRATSYLVKRSDGSDNAFVTIAEVNGTAYIDSTASNCTIHYYEVSPVNSVGEGAATTEVSAYQGQQLSGTLIGTTGSWKNNSSTTKAAAVDGNLNTFFDAAESQGAWVGYDLGADSAVVKMIKFAPRGGYPARMTGGKFQGAHLADFSDAVDLWSVTGMPAEGVLTTAMVNDVNGYRYLRYLGPANANCDVAEVQFYGLPAQLPLVSSSKQITGELNSSFKYEIDASPLPAGYTATGLPTGFALDACKGIISGNTAAQGNYRIPITVTNYYGTTKDTILLSMVEASTLGVNWSYFRGDRQIRSVSLHWGTVLQADVAYFVIERSSDGNNFDQVGKTKAIGLNGQLNEYNYTDDLTSSGTNASAYAGVESGTYYYRLLVVDKDGASHYSKIIKVTFNGAVPTNVAYPNPARNYAIVPGTIDCKVMVYDLAGQSYQVKASYNSAGIRLNVAGLNSGNYIIRVSNKLGDVRNYKITVLH